VAKDLDMGRDMDIREVCWLERSLVVDTLVEDNPPAWKLLVALR